MDMAAPPVVADLPTEAVSEVAERERGLLDDDVTVIGTCFMIKAPR